MIVKCLSKKGPVFGRLIDYFRRYHGPEAEHLPEPRGFNLLADPERYHEVQAEFLRNFQGFHSHRKNGVVCYHEILSPSPSEVDKLFAAAGDDAEQRAEVESQVVAMLYDLAEKWLSERAPDALGYMQVHGPDEDAPHFHTHILLSGNKIASERAVSLRKPEFLKVRDALWEYTRDRYPEIGLFHFDRTKKKEFVRAESQRRSNEKKREKRAQAPSQKTLMAARIRRLLKSCRSQEEFEAALRLENLEPYQRGQTGGLVDTATGRKYRLGTLGVLEEWRTRNRDWRIEAEAVRELKWMRDKIKIEIKKQIKKDNLD
jgi:hypothetical protein